MSDNEENGMKVGEGLSRKERETIIRRCADESTWDAYCSDPVVARKLLQVAASWDAEVSEMQRAIKVKLPKAAVSFRKRRILSEKQRAHIQSLAEARS